VLVLAFLPAQVALGVDPPDFTVDPPLPIAGELATFTANIPPEDATWDYEADGIFVPENTYSFPAAGSYDVTMNVSGGSPVTKTIVVNARPVASFDYSPALPDPNEWVVFESTSTDADDSIASFAWDFGDGTPGSPAPNPAHQFADPGQYDVTLVVTDQDGTTDSVMHQVDVSDPSVPTAAFDRDPDYSVLLETGQTATFTSDSSASPNSTLTWDIDSDGFDDGTGDSLTTSFATPGTKVVRLQVEQPNGESDIATSTFRVNAPPVAGFVWTPGSPVAGGEVQLYSTSVDAEGGLASEAWELDGDGDFDDALGSSATASFSAGDHEISLRVTDGDLVSRTVTRTITVTAPVIAPSMPPPAAAPLPPPAGPPIMNPFPTVRLVGIVMPHGARITLVEVRGAPRGARVTVRCTGRGCPFRSRRRVAETGRVRLSKFARVLAAGARIEVFVRAPGVIGRYVGFRIRAGKRPVRTDRCLLPGASEPTRCM
jgi:PKD repeat protein